MKGITTRLAVFAVVLTVALSMMAAPAVAAPGDTFPGAETAPGGTNFPDTIFDDDKQTGDGASDDARDANFPDTIFDEKFPDTIFDENDRFPDTIFDEKNLFPDTIFNDDEENQDGSDPVFSG